MQQAGFINFLRTILIIIVFYYVFKYIARLVFPLFFKKMMNSVEKKFNEQQRNSTNQEHVKEGETVIDKTPDQKNRSNDSGGEYIDYEEIE